MNSPISTNSPKLVQNKKKHDRDRWSFSSFLKNIIDKPSWHSSVGRASFCGVIGLGFEACRYMEENGSAAMLAAKRSGGVWHWT